MFSTFSRGFVNFDKEELDKFLEEFPEDNSNNPLYDIVEIYKTEDNFENLYYYFACILLCWSVLHLVIQILMFFLKDNDILMIIRKIFCLNGIILFFVKLICIGILIASHYSFYLKFKNAYLIIEEDPRNEILSDYKSLRRLFITKIFIIWISAFIIIFIELILFGIVITISRIYIEEIKKLKLIVINEKKYNEADRANQIKNFEVKEELKLKLNNDKTTEVLFEDNIKFFLNKLIFI